MINKFTVDLDIYKKYGFKLPQILYLISVYFNEPIHSKETLDELVKIGYVQFKHYNDGNPEVVTLTDNAIHFLETIFLDSEFKDGTSKGDRFIELAKALQEVYPEGKKQGTNYYWRDSTNVIARKLKALEKKYGKCFTDEQAIEATQKYVNSFNGNYQYMQLLKYFISKNVVKGGEVEETSQLLSYIENMNQEDSQMTINWDVELK